MKLKNGLPEIQFPIIPAPLKDNITIVSTCTLTRREQEIFYVAMQVIVQSLKKAPVPEEQLKINAIITDSDEITLQIEPESILGNCVRFVLYPVHRWRNMNLNDYQILTAIVEELCHAIWIIADEDLVKDKVTEVIKLYNPSVTRFDLYPGDALEKATQALATALISVGRESHDLRNPE